MISVRVLIWATTLQADLLALTLELDGDPACELLVVAAGAAAFLAEPIAGARPLASQVIDLDNPDMREAVTRFAADVVVVDNHFPAFPVAPRVLMMWHGAGWKSRSRSNLKGLSRHVARQTGAGIFEPNPRFMALCHGAPDRQWRIEQWHLDAGSCALVGMPFSDLVLAPPYSRADVASRYSIDVLRRPTVLLNLTWHYGRLFPGSWTSGILPFRATYAADLDALTEIVELVGGHGANLLLCLHDRHRYQRGYWRPSTGWSPGTRMSSSNISPIIRTIWPT